MADVVTNAGVVSFAEARRIVEQQATGVHACEKELVSLLAAPGRVLAEAIVADRDLPPFPRATRDGYAMRAGDVAAVSHPVAPKEGATRVGHPPKEETQGPSTRSPNTGTLARDDTREGAGRQSAETQQLSVVSRQSSAGTQRRLRVVGEVRAGGAFNGSVSGGEAVEIMTGAPVPAGADAVVMVEYTARDGEWVEVQRGVAPGENVVPAGAEAKRGATLLSAGTRLTPPAIAVAGACGRHELRVYRRPTVAILSTGDELVDVAAEPGPTQIRNSNSYSLAAQVHAAGGEPVVLPIAPDAIAPLRKLMQQGLASELLLLSGGVSMGKYDLVEQVLAEMGAEFFFTGAQIQPGRPVVFGRAPGRSGAQPTYFFGLPGNPVSTMVCFELFARAMVEALGGASPRKLVFLQARLKTDVRVKPGLTRFLPAVLSGEYERAEVEAVKWQGSGDMAANARANCYLVTLPDREILTAGEMAGVLIHW